MQLLVASVDYDGDEGQIAVTFNADGFARLAEEIACLEEV